MTLGNPIIIADYLDDWRKGFQSEQLILREVFGEKLVYIEHVGSTSVIGLAAKPVIDIMVGVRDFLDIEFLKNGLKNSDYEEVETTMPNRLFFQKKNKEVHLHVVPSEGFYERNELLFRDYLRRNSKATEEYANLKKKLAQQMGNNHEEYTKAKTDFIQLIVDLARDEKGLPRQKVWEE